MRAPVESLRKGLSLLDLLCGSERALSLAELASSMGWKRTTTHNLIKTLALCGYAENLGEGQYGPGWRVQDLGRQLWLRDHGDQARLAGSLVGEIASEVGESVVLALLSNGRRQVVARGNGTQVIRVDTDAMDAADKNLWSMVTGRVLAAHCEPAELARVRELAGDPDRHWPEAKDDTRLRAALDRICASGVAENDEEHVASLAIPVLADGRALAALGVYLPRFRYDAQQRERLLEGLRRGAARLAPVLRLGFSGETTASA